MLRESLNKLMRQENLHQGECTQVFTALLDEHVSPLQRAAFLVLLHTKKETVDELVALLSVLRARMISVPHRSLVLDIVGTGGDGANTINISTGSALLAASCGVKVAKHGNRAVSSLAGSADVLEALGMKIELSPEKVAASIEELNFGFCYAPYFHPMLQSLKELRRELNVPTSLNLLGPLLNPVNADYLMLGVYQKSLMPIMAATLQRLKVKAAMVLHGQGIDELSTVAKTDVIEVRNNALNETQIDPSQLGFSICKIEDLRGGDAKTNAAYLREVFAGRPSPIADTLILNAAYAMHLYQNRAILDAILIAKDTLYSGAVLTLLNRLVECTHD